MALFCYRFLPESGAHLQGGSSLSLFPPVKCKNDFPEPSGSFNFLRDSVYLSDSPNFFPPAGGGFPLLGCSACIFLRFPFHFPRSTIGPLHNSSAVVSREI